jgi:transcriptional regulator with XRE-family HTH domain
VFRGPKGERLDLAPFASKLKAIRERRGWTQKQLAHECEVSKSAVGYWEAMKKGPTWAVMAKLAKGLEVGYEQLGVPRSLVTAGCAPAQTKSRRGT